MSGVDLVSARLCVYPFKPLCRRRDDERGEGDDERFVIKFRYRDDGLRDFRSLTRSAAESAITVPRVSGTGQDTGRRPTRVVHDVVVPYTPVSRATRHDAAKSADDGIAWSLTDGYSNIRKTTGDTCVRVFGNRRRGRHGARRTSRAAAGGPTSIDIRVVFTNVVVTSWGLPRVPSTVGSVSGSGAAARGDTRIASRECAADTHVISRADGTRATCVSRSAFTSGARTH